MGLPRASLAASILLACSALGGCAATAVESDEAAVDSEEATDEAALAFGEATCASSAYANVTAGTVWPASYTGPTYAATTGGYGQTDCTHAFIVDYSNGTSYSSVIDVNVGTVPTTQASCAASHVRAKTYEEVGGAWVPFEETQLHGTWFFGSCFYVHDTGYGPLQLSTNPTRVTAQAYSTICLLGVCLPNYVGVKVRASTNDTE